MDKAKQAVLICKIMNSVEKRVREYMTIPADRNISGGNVALCIIDKDGEVYGRMFGTDKIKQRGFYVVAWKKASQVWITGYATGKFEELVYAKKLICEEFGLSKPDLIGWEGGQVVNLDNESHLSIGFSGFRGISDLEIVNKAVSEVLTGESFIK
jgi:glc operon protein GlcG